MRDVGLLVDEGKVHAQKQQCKVLEWHKLMPSADFFTVVLRHSLHASQVLNRISK